jgi:hypothetical protein
MGNLYFSHCYFENNYAARNSGSVKDGYGRGFLFLNYLLKNIKFCRYWKL